MIYEETDLSLDEQSSISQHQTGKTTLTAQFFASVLDIQELPDGYAFHLPLETEALHTAMNWVDNKRLCCRFLSFTLRIKEEFHLELTGIPEAKDYLRLSVVNKLLKMGIPLK